MKRFSIFVFSLLLATLLACSSPQNQMAEAPSSAGSAKAIFLDDKGSDSRTDLAFQYPFQTVGRIVIDLGTSRELCTGTMVGRRVMLTAAHCVLANGQVHAITFQADYANGKSLATATSLNIYAATTTPETAQASDWAVVQLSAPLGDTLGYMGVSTIAAGRLPLKVIYTGYSGNYKANEVSGTDASCLIHEQFTSGVQLNTYGHDCSMGPGGSGGPLFAIDPVAGDYRVFAVNTRGIVGGVYKTYESVDANIAVMNVDLVNKVLEFKKNYDQ